MGFRRDIFSGELIYFDTEKEKEQFRQSIEAIKAKYAKPRLVSGRAGVSWSKGKYDNALGVPVHQAKAEDDAAVKAGTGVRYDHRTGQAYYESRGARNREMMRRGLIDKSGGYGDFTGSSRVYVDAYGVPQASNPFRD